MCISEQQKQKSVQIIPSSYYIYTHIHTQHTSSISSARLPLKMTVTAADITTSGKIADVNNVGSEKYKGILYLATDQGQDKGLQPNGFAGLTSLGVPTRQVPVDVKVSKE